MKTNNPLQELADAYVAGALERGEAESFEERLLVDQEAREAVAAAVELLTTARAALATQEHAARPSGNSHSAQRWRIVDWVVTLGGACLLIVGLSLGAQPARNDGLAESEEANAGGELAMIWGEVLATSLEEEDAGEDDASIDDLLNGLDGEFQISDSPDWMLAAVGELSSRDDMNHEVDMENHQ